MLKKRLQNYEEQGMHPRKTQNKSTRKVHNCHTLLQENQSLAMGSTQKVHRAILDTNY